MQQRALALLVCLGLLLASAGAFALAQGLKLERATVEAVKLSPYPASSPRDHRDNYALFSPRGRTPATVRFRLHDSRPASAEVVNASGAAVRALGVVVRSGLNASVTWNGRDDAGKAVTDGPYYIKLRLHARTLRLPSPLIVDGELKAWSVTSVKGFRSTDPARARFSPDGDTHGDVLVVSFSAKERLVHHELTVRSKDGKTRVRSALDDELCGTTATRKKRHLALCWDGTDEHGNKVVEGEYRIAVTVTDRAGNVQTRELGLARVRTVLFGPPGTSVLAGSDPHVSISADTAGFLVQLARVGDPRPPLPEGIKRTSPTECPVGRAVILAWTSRSARTATTCPLPATLPGGYYEVVAVKGDRIARAPLAVRGRGATAIALLVPAATPSQRFTQQLVLNRRAETFDALIVPARNRLGSTAAAAVRSYERAGGRVVASAMALTS